MNDDRHPAVSEPTSAGCALTFDVEEWFHAGSLAIPPHEWDSIPSRLDGPIGEILSLLTEHETSATFFMLGWIAARRPQLVRKIHAAGHEIASHGHWHRRVDRQGRNAFSDDVRRAKATIEDAIGEAVIGYRAPGYSIDSQAPWAFDELEAAGFAYDSSIYPARAPHGGYGVSGAPLRPHLVRSGLCEFPLPTWRVLGRRFPAATGAYLRLLPLAATRLAIEQNLRHEIHVVVNIHPWELDVDQPRREVSPWTALRHYGGLRGLRGKLARLLESFRFGPLRDMHAQYMARSACRPRDRDPRPVDPSEFGLLTENFAHAIDDSQRH